MELLEHSARLAAAAVAGGLIGLNRDLHNKPSGMRTLALVGLGSALATAIVSDSLDAASRVLQGLVTGIGFLGAGVIVKNKDGTDVEGLTTAATIWLTASIGAACGLGAWRLVLAACVFTGVILIAGKRMKMTLEGAVKGTDETPPPQDPAART